MSRLFVCVAVSIVCSAVWACAPTKTRTPTQSNDNSTARRRRSLEDVVALIVSSKKYDESAKAVNLKKIRNIIASYEKKEGLHIDFEDVSETVKNHQGRFAVEYKAFEECERVKNYVRGAKATSKEIGLVLVKCGEENIAIF